jgi:nucleotide-binding universal stress UspA family protein
MADKQKNAQSPIVCGTDFSAAAGAAADIAAAIARKLGTKLLLAHVDEFYGLAEVDPALFDAAFSQKRDKLEREVTRLRNAGTAVELHLLSGSPFEQLVTTAVESKARLIVVGAMGHGVAKRLLVGSAAERIAETSPVPTLVVRPGSRILSWLHGEHPLKLLLGYDFSAAGDNALRWTNEMQALGRCEIQVAYVDWPPDAAHRFGYRGPLPLTESPQQIRDFLERDLAQRVALYLPSKKDVALTVEPGWGTPEGYLFQLANRQHADLMVVGTHRRHGWGRLRFGSVSRTVLHHATMSVAVIPPGEERKDSIIPTLDRVLVATDFSDLGNRAVGYGCAIVRQGGILKLIHVIDPGSASGEPKMRCQLLARLGALIPPDISGRCEVEQEIIEGDDTAVAITQEAERFDAGAICMGSHGRAGLTRAFLGSVARAVMESSKRPVFVVREQKP